MAVYSRSRTNRSATIIATHSQPGDLWTLLLGDGRTLDPTQAGSVSFPPTATAGQLEIRWTDFRESQAPDLTVTARITLDPAAPVSQWRIAVAWHGRPGSAIAALPSSDRDRSSGSRGAGGAGVDGRADAAGATTAQRTRRRETPGMVVSWGVVAAVPGALSRTTDPD